MAEREVLKEFLTKLGFTVDQPSLRNWLSMLKKACLSAAALRGTVLGVVVALEALVVAFANSMEKLYYASIRTRTSAGNIQALEFALGQVGLEAEQARALLEHLGSQLRVNPATQGLLKMLGVETEGRDRLEVVLDLLKKLKAQFTGNQYMIGARFAERLLGVDERTYFQLTSRLGEIEAAVAARNKKLKESGIDADAAAKASRQFMNELRNIWDTLGLIKDRMAIEYLPIIREINAIVGQLAKYVMMLDFSKWDETLGKVKKEFGEIGEVVAWVLRLLWTASKIANPLNFKGNVEDVVKAARAGVDALRGGTPGGGQSTGGRITTGASADGFPVESRSEAASAARRALEIMMSERASGQGGPDLDREIARTEGLIRSLSGAPTIPAGVSPPPPSGLGTGTVSGGINFNVNSHVVIHGATDPAATGRAVEDSQGRLYSDAVRNLEGVAR